MIVIDGITVAVLYSSVYIHLTHMLTTMAQLKPVKDTLNVFTVNVLVLIVRILLLLLCRRKMLFKLSR